jgi:hypothetical protein
VKRLSRPNCNICSEEKTASEKLAFSNNSQTYFRQKTPYSIHSNNIAFMRINNRVVFLKILFDTPLNPLQSKRMESAIRLGNVFSAQLDTEVGTPTSPEATNFDKAISGISAIVNGNNYVVVTLALDCVREILTITRCAGVPLALKCIGNRLVIHGTSDARAQALLVMIMKILDDAEENGDFTRLLPSVDTQTGVGALTSLGLSFDKAISKISDIAHDNMRIMTVSVNCLREILAITCMPEVPFTLLRIRNLLGTYGTSDVHAHTLLWGIVNMLRDTEAKGTFTRLLASTQ